MEPDRDQRGDVRRRNWDKGQGKTRRRTGRRRRITEGAPEGPGEPCSARDLPPPPHLADEGELASPDVVTIQPEGEDGS